MRNVTLGALLFGALLLQGCGRSNPPPPDLVKQQREALEKAKATEKMVQDAAQRHDAQIESQVK
jgi:PBP1b-binding outer membrane lipoprotein LpoB